MARYVKLGATPCNVRRGYFDGGAISTAGLFRQNGIKIVVLCTKKKVMNFL